MTTIRFFMTALVVMLTIPLAHGQNPRTGEMSLGNSPYNHSQEWTETTDADTALANATRIPGTILGYHTLNIDLGNQGDGDAFGWLCPEGERRQFRIFDESPKSSRGWYSSAQLWYVPSDPEEMTSYSVGHSGDVRPLLYFSCNPGEEFFLGHGPMVTYYESNARVLQPNTSYTHVLGNYRLEIDSRRMPRFVQLEPKTEYCTYPDMPVFRPDELDMLEMFYFNPVSQWDEDPGDIFGQVVELDMSGLEPDRPFTIGSSAMLQMTLAVVTSDGMVLQSGRYDYAEPFINFKAPDFLNQSYGGTLSWFDGWSEDLPDRVYLFMGSIPSDPSAYRVENGEVCVIRRVESDGSASNRMYVEFIYSDVQVEDLSVQADSDSMYVSFRRPESSQNNGFKIQVRRDGNVILESSYQEERSWIATTDTTYNFSLPRNGVQGDVVVEVLALERQVYLDNFAVVAELSVNLLPGGTPIESGPNEDQVDVTVYPNPSNGHAVTVQVVSPDPRLIRLEVFDALGRQLYQSEGQVLGTTSFSLSGLGLSSGMYTVRVLPLDSEADSLTRYFSVLR